MAPQSLIASVTRFDQMTDDRDLGHQSCSHVCPNCDGDITLDEHSLLGVCSDCYELTDAVGEHLLNVH